MSSLALHIAAFAFVDDVDMIQTEAIDTQEDPHHIDQLCGTTQSPLNLWTSNLEITGGAIEPSKTFYVPAMIHKWQGRKPKFDTSHQQM